MVSYNSPSPSGQLRFRHGLSSQSAMGLGLKTPSPMRQVLVLFLFSPLGMTVRNGCACVVDVSHRQQQKHKKDTKDDDSYLPGTPNNQFFMVVSIGWFNIFTWEMVGNHQTSIKNWLFRVPGIDPNPHVMFIILGWVDPVISELQ